MACKFNKLAFETRFFYNNEFHESSDKKVFETVNPFDESLLAKVFEASAADVDAAVTCAAKAFETFQYTEGSYRRDLLLRLSNLLEEHREEIAEIESLDSGKPMAVTNAVDIGLMIKHIRYYAGWADKIQGKCIPTDNFGGNKYLVYTKHEPVGVVAQVIPWNFPLLMLSWKLAPAIAVGCTVVIKTSEKTPLSALKFAQLIVKAGFPPGVVNILSGYGHTTGHNLVRHPKAQKVAFTGSTVSGLKVLVAAAETGMKRTTMELGGKSPLIVFDDCDLEVAVQTAHTGLFFNMGQCCIASSRVFVHENIADKFVELLKKKAEGSKMLCPQDPNCTQGPQIDSIQFEKVMGYIEQGKKEGATLVTGGKRHGTKGYFVEPTIFADMKDDMVLAKEEIFGPVISVFKFKTLDEVAVRANDSPYGLGAGICTKDIGKAYCLANQLKAGTVYINCWNVFDAAAPFGGFKTSGQGRELGENGLHPYIEVKTVITNLSYKE